ncbi:MAG: porin [Gemmatimonadaceae bacterium]|nr:porin [Gemmatimonadaceae bacterium]
MQRLHLALFASLLAGFTAAAPVASQQATGADSARAGTSQRIPDAPAPWYERLSIRGYAQVRYNRLLESNADLKCAQCDKSIGDNGGFFLRRGRIVLFGNVHPRVYVYVQSDFGSDAAGGLHYFQLRDAYFDLYVDSARTHRLRFGQSKIPFGFENLQSSQNRLPLDRHDGLNSALPNERDIGVLYYATPAAVTRRFRTIASRGLKHSGDYGMFGFGLFNGQSANRPEANNSLHAVARLTYPWELPNGQFVETGIQAYSGRFVPLSTSAGVTADAEYRDERAAATLVVYPQPFGLVAEYNIGRGPQYVPGSNAIESRRVYGGFVQAMYRWTSGTTVVIPFVRYHEYSGGKKAETDARHYDVNEVELGVEWSPFPAFELTAMFTNSDRLFEDATSVGNRQKGRFLRLQAQFNY